MPQTPVIDVTCAIVRHNGKILVTRRGPHKSQPLLWEFPGGKVEPGETAVECIHRELFEELGIRIHITSRLEPVEHPYENITIRLLPFLADFIPGDITLREHVKYEWVNPDNLTGVDWAPADVGVVKQFKEYIKIE